MSIDEQRDYFARCLAVFQLSIIRTTSDLGLDDEVFAHLNSMAVPDDEEKLQ
jgi:hypothetical protein